MEDVEPPSARALSGMCVDLCGLRPLASASYLPVSDWVVVRVRAAALGLPDVTMARGSYPVEIARPYTAGLEAAGIVEEASPSMAEWLGRRVVTFTPQPFGSLAPLAVGLRDAMFEVPEGLSDEEAAAFLLASHTSYHALVRRGGLRAGETALILGAAGGLGSAAIQLARAVGARVLAVAGGAEKADFCRRLGAETVIDHLREDVVERARQALAPEGRHVLCGHAGGLRPIDPCSFYMQNLTLVGATMGAYPPPLGRQIEEDAHRAILELCRAGRYRPAVGAVVAFAEVPGALEDLAARRTLGRTVVRIG
jgi:NADPH2:quinone reductase